MNKFVFVIKIISTILLLYCGFSLVGISIRVENMEEVDLDVPDHNEREYVINNTYDVNKLQHLLQKSDEAFDSMLTYSLASQKVIQGIKTNIRKISHTILLSTAIIIVVEVFDRRRKGLRAQYSMK